ncbi:MAG TPA: tetratricopeptide repeat protein [Gemmatimonadales bacterium]
MKIATILAAGSLAMLAAPLAGQTIYNTRVAQAMKPHGRYQAPICPLKGDFRSNSAALDLKTATEGFTDQSGGRTVMDSKKYTDGVIKAVKAASDAIAATPQNAAAWYYLGRADLQLGDLKGADSALTKAEALAPDCAEDIKGFRQTAWLPLVTPSAEFMRLKQNDSALAVLRDALTIARYYPQGFYNLGGTFMNMNQLDSAAYYFKIAQDKAGTDPQFAGTQKGATYNLAYIYQDKGDNANAIIEYRKYLAIDSTDVDIKRALAGALRATGDAAGADKIQGEMAASGTLNTTELNEIAIRAFTAKDYNGAAEGFLKVLAVDPWNHDAQYNLANSYLGLKDGKKLVVASQRLLEIAPLGMTNAQLLVNGYRLQADTTKWIDAVGKLQAMPIGVTIKGFAVTKDGAKVTGVATGNDATTPAGKAIVPAPVTLVFDFLDAKGAVVTSQEVAIPALQKDATQDITVTAAGAGISDWRYHVK